MTTRSLLAEQALIGLIMISPSAMANIDLLPSDFLDESLREAYETTQRMAAENQVVNVITVSAELDRMTGRDWIPILGELAKNTVITEGSAKEYARVIREESRVRTAVSVAENMVFSLRETKGLGAVDSAIRELMAIGQESMNYDYTAKDMVRGAVDRLEAAFEAHCNGKPMGIPSGLIDLDKSLGGFHKTDLIVIPARPAMGKELWAGSKVMTAHEGWKRIDELIVGDKVASIDGEDSFVTGVFPQGEKPLFEVSFQDGRSVLAGLDHQWEVMYRDWDSARVVTTNKLIEMLGCKRYQNRLSIPLFDGDCGVERDYPLHPWLVGALLGDGCLSAKKGGVHFSTKDSELRDRFNSLLPIGYQLSYTSGVDYRVAGAGNGKVCEIRKKLIALGMYGLLSYEKSVPKVYLEGSRLTRLEVLKGLMDTDGWVEKTGATVFCSASKQLAEDVAYLVRSLGGKARVTEKPNKHAGAFNVYIQHKHPKEIFSLERKALRAKEANSHAGKPAELRLTLKDINYVRDDEAYCISVSHNRALYITESFIVTHNTALMLNLALGSDSRCGIISSEQGHDQLGLRCISIDGNVSSHNMRTGDLNDADWCKITASSSRLINKNIWINDKSSITIEEIQRKTREWVYKYDIEILFVDYIQRIKTTKQFPTKIAQVEEVTVGLKNLAKELGIPVVALAQVNRECEKRPNKRPHMGDVADASIIEKECDSMIILYRDEVYSDDSPDKGIAELDVVKNRHGPTGVIRAAWRADYLQFKNMMGAA